MKALSALSEIRQIDYTVIFVRDMAAMRQFYETVLGFPVLQELSASWVSYRSDPRPWRWPSTGAGSRIRLRRLACCRCSWRFA